MDELLNFLARNRSEPPNFNADNAESPESLGSDRSISRKALRDAQQIVSGERQLIDSKYLWAYVGVVAAGSGLFMLAVGGVAGWLFRGLIGS